MTTSVGPRYRERGSTTRVAGIGFQGKLCNGTVIAPTANLGNRVGVLEGTRDIVTPNFRLRAAKGEIINNPYENVKQTFSGGGDGYYQTFAGCNASNPSSYAESAVPMYYRAKPDYLFDPLRDLAGQLTMPVSVVDVGSLIKHSHTKALAGVDDSTLQGIVSLGELGKTIATLRNPIESLTRFTEKWKRSRTLEKALSGGPTALANQYLTYYYGIKPTMLDVQNAISAYLNVGIKNSRNSARATATDSRLSSHLEGGNLGGPFSWHTVRREDFEQVTVRSGILYDVDHRGSVAAEYGLRLSDVPSALLELTPWSFFASYFANISELVSALSPRWGVEYLASWDVIRVSRKLSWAVIAGGSNEALVTARPSTEYASVLYEGTRRMPSSPYDNVGLSVYKSTKILDWSTQKNLAIISLAFQQLSRLHTQMSVARKG